VPLAIPWSSIYYDESQSDTVATPRNRWNDF